MPVNGMKGGRTGPRGFRGLRGPAGSIASVPATQTVAVKTLPNGTTAFLAADLNSYILCVASTGAVITLPAGQPVGTWVVLRISGNAVTYGSTTLAVDTTVTYMIFTGDTWQTMQ